MNRLNSPSRLDDLWNKVVSFYLRGPKESLAKFDIHGCDHIYRVWNNVKMIKDTEDVKEWVNYELIQSAAILHDIGYLHTSSNQIDDHVKKSMAMSRKILQSLSFVDEEIKNVQKIISGHHNQYDQLNLEQKILLVADQLDLLGLDGTLREFIRLSPKLQNRDEMAEIILQKSNQRYAELIKLKVGKKLVTKKWRQSEWYLMQIKAKALPRVDFESEN